MPTLAEINVRIGAKIEQFERGLRNAERALTRSGRKFERLGQSLTTSVSLPLAAAGVAALTFAGNFEESFTKIETLVGITGKSLEDFSKGITNLSGPLGKSQTELSDALFTITSAGQRGEAALETLEQASKASSIGLGETADVARAATAIVQAYGEANISSAQAVDQLTAIVREGNLEASELAPVLGRVLPVAAQLGISFNEVGANIATFTRLGVSASESVSGLKALLSNILKPSADAQKELARLGISADDLRKSIKEKGLAATLQGLLKLYDGNTEALARLFPSVEGLTNALGTAGAQGEEYARIVGSIENANGIVDKGFEKVSQTANFKLKQALVSLQSVSAEFGATLIPIVTDLLNAVVPLVQGFGNLDDSTKKVIVSTGAAVAAVGPLIKVYGTLQTSYAALLGVSGKLVGSFRNAATAFSALDKVTKATAIGAVVAVVATAVVAFNDYSNQLTRAEKVQQSLNAINQEAEQSLASQRAAIAKLTIALKAENATEEEQEAIKRKIIALNPQYLSGFINEKSSLEEVTQALDGYLENLRKSAQLKAANAQLEELFRQLADVKKLAEDAEPTGIQKIFNTFAAGGNTIVAASLNAQTSVANLGETYGSLNDQIDATLELIGRLSGESNVPVTANVSTSTAPVDFGNVSTTIEAADPFEGLRGGISQTIPQLNLLNEETQRNIELLQEQAAATDATRTANEIMAATYDNSATPALDAYNQQLIEAQEQLAKQQEQYAPFIEVVDAFGNTLVDSAKKGKLSVEDLTVSVLSSAVKQIGALIRVGVAGAVSSALVSTPPPANLIIAGLAGAVAQAAFTAAFAKGGAIPALAEGGLAFGPTLAVVGDNPNAKADPEVVAPLSKLKSIIGDVSGGTHVTGTFRVQGTDLLLVLEQAQQSRRRRQGF